MGGSADTAMARPLPAGAQAKPQAAPAVPSAGGGGAGPRIIKFFCAIALIPLCVGMSLGVHEHFLSTWSRVTFAVHGPGLLLKWFGIGIACFTGIAILFWRPVVLYVFGHELVHALATWMCLGKVTNLTASASGGQVTTSKTNTFIRLAPYCVPLYAVMAVAIFAGLNAWWRPIGEHMHWLAYALGFFYAFHIGFTLWSLRRDQPDLKPDGWLFSLVMIYLGNIAVFVLLFGFLFHGEAKGSVNSLKDTAQAGWGHSTHIYRNLGRTADEMINR
jgi:hypothetical protein